MAANPIHVDHVRRHLDEVLGGTSTSTTSRTCLKRSSPRPVAVVLWPRSLSNTSPSALRSTLR